MENEDKLTSNSFLNIHAKFLHSFGEKSEISKNSNSLSFSIRNLFREAL
jgi:hypothetical protein